MGLNILDWSVVGGYFILVMLLGWWARKLIKTQGDFILGGRRFGGVMLSFLSFGSGTHTDQAVITASAAYQHGFSGIWVQLMWLFVTPFYWLMAPIYRRARCYTSSDIFERRFGHGFAAAYTLLNLIISTLIMGMMLKAAAMMFTGMTGGAFNVNISLFGNQFVVESGHIIIAVMTVLFVVYGVLGGLIAAIWTDVLQGVFTIVLSFLMIPFALAKLGGFAGFHAQMPNHDAMFCLVNPAGIGIFFIVMTVINGIIGNAGHAGTIMSFAAGRTEVEGRVGKVYGNMLKRFCIVGWGLTGIIGVIFYGLYSKEAGTGIPPEEVFGRAAHDLLPAGLVGLMLASAMAAMMSTCDVMMVGSAGLFTENLWKRYLVPNASERHYVRVNRISSVFVVVGGLFFSYTISSLLQALTWLWSWPTILGIVFWLGIFLRRANAWGAWASFLSSSGLYFYCNFLPVAKAPLAFLQTSFGKFLLYPLYLRAVENLGYLRVFPWLVVYYLVAGIGAGILVSFLTPRPDKKRIDDFYLTISTPIGEEAKLKAAGVDIIYR